MAANMEVKRKAFFWQSKRNLVKRESEPKLKKKKKSQKFNFDNLIDSLDPKRKACSHYSKKSTEVLMDAKKRNRKKGNRHLLRIY